MRLLRTAVLALLPLAAWAAGCRFTLADQSNWTARRGFYLALESDEICRAAGVKLTLGVGDGEAWRFALHTPAWQFGHEYSVKAVIAPAFHELYLDGQRVERGAGSFVPEGAALVAGASPEWAAPAADFIVTQTAFTLASSSGRAVSIEFPRTPRPAPLALLAPAPLRKISWAASADETWTLLARFRLESRPDPAALAPYIDRYGQSVHARWPGKIARDEDLKDAAALEEQRLRAWGVAAHDTGWSAGCGFYRAGKRDGRWWLITPEGNPCFYIGLNTAPALIWDRTPVTGRLPGFFAELPPTAGVWADAWGRNSWGGNDGVEDVSFAAANLIRKFGDNWRQAEADLTVRRVKAWGFSGLGKWASDGGRLPSLPVLSRAGVPNLVRHPDIFDPAVRRRFREELARQILPRAADPLVVGWSVGSEMDEIVTSQEIAAILKLAAAPACRALAAEALTGIYSGDAACMAKAWGTDPGALHPPAADIERLRRFYARAYYRFLYETVKSVDPNHLYFGFWIVPGWWENEEDWRLIAPYCDVIGYDNYSEQFADGTLARLIRETAKPVFAGEFSFPPTYALERGFQAYSVNAANEAESGERYAAWLDSARANPLCVGVGWFQYRDQPVGGRGPGHGPALAYGESYAFGLVDVGDRPKWDLVERVRQANLQAIPARRSSHRRAIR
ncbi:MAG TPA: hypothetical protein VF767_00590 [Bryobacteraceae bacterium]